MLVPNEIISLQLTHNNFMYLSWKKAWQINQIAKKREKADPEDQICQALDPYVGKTSHFGVINFVSDKSEPTNCFPSMT